MQAELIKILAIGSGGFLGATSRYLFSNYVQSHFEHSDFPYGTFVVNVLGCLLIGLLAGFTQNKEWLSTEIRLFLFIGLLGGFTTFSTFANDSLLLFKDGALWLGLWYTLGQVIIGIISVWIGYYITRWFV